LYTACHRRDLFQPEVLFHQCLNGLYTYLLLLSRVHLRYNTSEQVWLGVIQGTTMTVVLYMFVVGPGSDTVLAEYFADITAKDKLSPESIKLM